MQRTGDLLTSCLKTRLLILSLLLVPGCSVWDSMTAYFNTYYNAQRVFAEVETDLWAQRDIVQLGRHYYLAPMYSTNRTKLTSVIEKCSKLLESHPKSGLVDDALLLIGLAYYYQMDDQQADRKFRELIGHDPDGPLVLRARMLRGYVAYRMGQKDSAEAFARSSLEAAEAEGEEEIAGHAALLLGQIERDRPNGRAAIAYYVRAGETAENPELRTTAFLIAGGIADTLGEFARAESLFVSAEKVSRNYVGEFRGKMGAARMRGLRGDREGSLARLGDLRDNQNFREFFPEIDLEIAHVYRKGGEREEAELQYRYVDTAYARTESAARGCYTLGSMFEEPPANYDSASVWYQKGRGHGTQYPIGPLLNQKADAMARYITLRNELAKNDSLIGAWRALRDSLLAKPDSTRRMPSIDSLENRIAVTRGDLATLFYLSLDRTDSAEYWYRRLIADAPDHPAVPRALYALAQITKSDSLYSGLASRFPRSEFANEARRILGLPQERTPGDEAEGEYARAERLMLEGKDAAAITAFRAVAVKHPTSAAAPRAQYAIGWLHEQGGRSDSSIANYQVLISRYPASPFAARVQPKMIEAQNFRIAAQNDSLARKNAAERVDTTGTKTAPPAQTDSTGLKKSPLPASERDEEGVRSRRGKPVTTPPQKPPAEVPKE